MSFASVGTLLALTAGGLGGCSGTNAATTGVDASIDATDGSLSGETPVGLDVPPGDGSNDGSDIDVSTCAGAAAARSNIGCDYWPTVTANEVWSIFDFAVVVANAGTTTAEVSVTGPNGFSTSVTVDGSSLTKIYLPWVSQLKGPDSDSCGDVATSTASVLVTGGAYHLVSSVPVSVYQFNPIEYQPKGGPPGKDWSTCPGDPKCGGCYSYSNDASLLLPTTAMTGNYRIAGIHGWTGTTGEKLEPGFVVVTGTQDGTTVKLQVGSKGTVIAGTGITATAAGGVLSFTLGQGDVAEIFGDATTDSDLSGSLLEASAPVQVITGSPCMENPVNTDSCDHLEQSNFPAETLGKHYFVTVPTGPHGTAVGHVVRFYGAVDGTNLTYGGTTPTGAPTTMNAGDVVDVGVVSADFEVTGDQPFTVGSFQLGQAMVDPKGFQGDPSESFASAVEQYRKRYVFLAPDDYLESYADVIAPADATLTLDGAAVTATANTISSGFAVFRVLLGAGNAGAHVLTSTAPAGLQVSGYGLYTSYQYPGGSNLDVIASPPPVIH